MKVREGGRTTKIAVIATGVNAEAYRELLGVDRSTCRVRCRLEHLVATGEVAGRAVIRP